MGSGGSRAACKCLMSCTVFTGMPDRCEDDSGHDANQKRSTMLHKLIDAALTSVHDACDAMRCIVDCSRKLECFDRKVKGDCESLLARESQRDCLLNCDTGSYPSSSIAVESAAEDAGDNEEHG